VIKTHWNRRQFIVSGAGSVAALPFIATPFCLATNKAEPICVLNLEQEEGPYYIDREILRKDISEGKPGVPLLLHLTLIDVRTCQPVENAALDIWHCDALGNYSGYRSPQARGSSGPDGPGGPSRMPPPVSASGGPQMGGPPKMQPTDDAVFLRGVQLSDSKGNVEFETIYPGCYIGRTNHIHLKVHIGGHAAGKEYQGGHVAHTGQIFSPRKSPAQSSR
jgi:hypothetical protein